MQRILILGGTGFVGRALCEHIPHSPALAGARVLVPSRRRERGKHLFPLPHVDVVDANVHDEATLVRLLAGCDAVVNLVAILHGTPQAFRAAHVDLVQRLVGACLKTGVRRLVHVSALGVPDDPAQAPSNYLRSKAEGEGVLRQAAASGLSVGILRPSVIFGAQDRFLNLFAALQRLFPAMPLAGSQARFQPVWVEDVAAALVKLLEGGQTGVYEAAGPQVLTLAELVQRAGRWSGHARPVLPIPDFAGRMQATMMGLLPGEPLMSTDNLDSMKVPNVASGRLPGLAELGVTPHALDAVGPGYLGEAGAMARQMDLWRSLARRG
ncbi:NAD-dependent dehydratase [Aquabacterium olei]|uniref:NAD-dependent dehydratase n=1 Tax=Aquabacterium olei TaxID=1296669 RepID=A0A2U8FV44_9BURK|nr:complex I NDUFA9 subunit family protein [Aquabacterium olei]AWI54941.1 NAD-dependent dehydratase [Aquabacterium olei]